MGQVIAVQTTNGPKKFDLAEVDKVVIGYAGVMHELTPESVQELFQVIDSAWQKERAHAGNERFRQEQQELSDRMFNSFLGPK